MTMPAQPFRSTRGERLSRCAARHPQAAGFACDSVELCVDAVEAIGNVRDQKGFGLLKECEERMGQDLV